MVGAALHFRPKALRRGKAGRSGVINELGVHALVFVGGWNARAGDRAIRKAAECGFRHLEIPLLDPASLDAKRVAVDLERFKVAPITSLGLGFDSDISSGDPEKVNRGQALLMEALARARDVGSTLLTGVLYSALGKYRAPPTEAGRWNCIEVLGRLAAAAKRSGITLGLEPVNRYESNLVNTAGQALALIDEIGADNMVVHLDSYHMNIEEGDPDAVIAACGDRLGYVHVNESHRGYLGTGSIDFAGLFAALARHGYRGIVTFEAFSAGIGDPALNAELAVWRKLFDDPDDLARHARAFMAEGLAAAARADWPAAQPATT
jgi:D-psicose/D-tagatose/L-ribulose 3-epimerase